MYSTACPSSLVKSHLIMLVYLLHKANGSGEILSLPRSRGTIYLNFLEKHAQPLSQIIRAIFVRIPKITCLPRAPFRSKFYLSGASTRRTEASFCLNASAKLASYLKCRFLFWPHSRYSGGVSPPFGLAGLGCCS